MGTGDDGDEGVSGGKESIPEFVGQAGCPQDMSNKSPMEFFQLFITDEMLGLIVEQTNLFAQQYLDSHELPPLSRARQWNKSSHMVAELKRFRAAVIVMGLIDYPCVEDCWVTSWPYSTTTFRSILTCDRFSLIMKFFHLNDSSRYIPKRQPGYDPLYKLRPFMDPLLTNFRADWQNYGWNALLKYSVPQ